MSHDSSGDTGSLEDLPYDELRDRAFAIAEDKHDYGFFVDLFRHTPAMHDASDEGGSLGDISGSLVETIRAIHARGTTIVWIEHIVHALIAVVDRLVVLHGGALIADGDPRSVIKSPRVEEIYMGIPAHA